MTGSGTRWKERMRNLAKDRGVKHNQLWADMTLAGYNLFRLAKLA